MRHKDLFKISSSFYKLASNKFAGLIAAPPMMLDEIEKWAKSIFNEYMNDPDLYGERLSYNKNFNLNLEHLPLNYKLHYGLRYENKIREIEFIKAYVLMNHDDKHPNGEWQSFRNVLIIDLGKHPEDEVNFVNSEIEDIVNHELQHMMQDVLYYTKNDSKNNPKNIYNGESKYPKIKNDTDELYEIAIYSLNPAEFKTMLGSCVRSFIENVIASKNNAWPSENESEIKTDITKKDFNEFIGNPRPNQNAHKFFRSLYFYDQDLWKKAVVEFYKLVSLYLK